MGGQLYTVFRPSVPEAQPPDDVRALYLHLDEADRLAREIGVTPLGNFLSAAVEGPIEAWFSLEDGLRTVKGLATAIRERPREPGNWAYNIDHEFAALEPYVRRIWPFGLMGWTRLFSGHYRDPLVGRDLLAGAAAGSFMAMAAPVRDVASRLLEGGAPMPVANGLAGLLGFRYSVVTTINILLTSINNAFLVVLLFVLVWMVVRRAWLALGITAALLASMVLAQIGSASFAGFLYLSFIVGMGAFVLWRFGLLAMITALFFEMALRQSPFTLNLSAWYAAPTLVVLGTLSSITVFAFVSSRAGEPLFGRTLLPD